MLHKAIFRSYHHLKRDALFGHLKELEKTQWLSPAEIEKIQWRKLKKLLDHAHTNVPYYRELFENMDITPGDINTPKDYALLPLLDKEEITQNSGRMLSQTHEQNDLISDSTGGSTGLTLDFYKDRKTSYYVAAMVYRNASWAGLGICTKNARLWGSPFDIDLQKNLKNRIDNWISRTLFLSSYNLSDENMQAYAKRLVKYQPRVITGYPSSLSCLAKFISDNRISGINPDSVITSAETLYEFQRELIESAFNCEVFNRYGCREFSTVAHECPEHKGMHINAEHVYVECIRDGEAVPFGESGELVVTDLDNYAMPFMRYRIGDVGTLSQRKCKCGRGLPLIEKIEGRTFDVIEGVNGHRLGGTFWTLLFRTSVEGIMQFQVVQESDDAINIKIVVSELFNEEYLVTLRDKIREYCGEKMKIGFEIVDKIPLTKSGKFRFVISKKSPSKLV